MIYGGVKCNTCQQIDLEPSRKLERIICAHTKLKIYTAITRSKITSETGYLSEKLIVPCPSEIVDRIMSIPNETSHQCPSDT